MLRARRRGVHANTWPGFVDAMTGLLLVLMFVLTIFTVVQFTLRDQISGQQTRLDELASEVNQLTSALGLSQGREATLTDDLSQAIARGDEQASLIDSLTRERDLRAAELSEARTRITSFEAQVAGLLADKAQVEERVASLEAQTARQVDEAEALNLALASAREEINTGEEQARLAAARREALEALTRSLQNRTAEQGEALSEAEAQRLTDAAAAQALRERLEGSEAELTAMTLSLEEQRKQAEETLTLLAAAESARDDLDMQLAAAILARQQAEALASEAENRSEDLDARLLAALSLQENTEAELQAARETLEAVQAEGADLSTRLAAALSARDLTAGNLEAAQAALEEALGEAQVSREEAEERLAQAILSRDAAEAQREETAARLAALEAEGRGAAEALAAAQAEGQEVQARLADEIAARRAAEQELQRLSNEREDLSAQLAEAVLRQEEATQASEAALADDASLRTRLAEALARAESAEEGSREVLTESERQAALLAAAQSQLQEEEALSAESQRQVAALNEQVAELRNQVGTLQTLLDVSQEADEQAQVQIESLGSELNTALARVAAEQRQRAELEEAERRRVEEEARRLAVEAQDLESYKSEFFGNMRRLLEGREGIQVVGDRFVFSSEVLFDPGSATLSPEGRQQIGRVARLLREISADVPAGIDWVIQVDGHTDDTPIGSNRQFRDNWELSQARALSVVREMSDVEGIPPERLSANGYGEFQPIDTSNTPEGQARNRRIEIKLTER